MAFSDQRTEMRVIHGVAPEHLAPASALSQRALASGRSCAREMAADAAGDAVEGCPRCGLLDELEGDAAAHAPQGRPIPMNRDQVEVEVEHRLAAGPPVQAQDVQAPRGQDTLAPRGLAGARGSGRVNVVIRNIPLRR